MYVFVRALFSGHSFWDGLKNTLISDNHTFWSLHNYRDTYPGLVLRLAPQSQGQNVGHEEEQHPQAAEGVERGEAAFRGREALLAVFGKNDSPAFQQVKL